MTSSIDLNAKEYLRIELRMYKVSITRSNSFLGSIKCGVKKMIGYHKLHFKKFTS